MDVIAAHWDRAQGHVREPAVRLVHGLRGNTDSVVPWAILSRNSPSEKPGTIQLGVMAGPSLIIDPTSISTISSLESLQ